MNRLAPLSVIALAAAAPGAGVAAADGVPAGYRLVWHDEFDGSGAPDAAKWGFEQGFVRNDETQWYQRNNVRVENGLLVIEARRENRRNPLYRSAQARPAFRNRPTIAITSGSVTTAGLASWTYGRFEIRAKLTAAQGLWPALWFVGDRGPWPAGGEIDLMEYYGGRVLANFAWASSNPGKPVWSSVRTPVESLGGPGWDDGFHTWVMDWDARRITLSLDGRELNRIDLDRVRSPEGLDNPFRHPQHLIMNLALGGTRGGPTADTRLPSRFEIDYVRVYQRDGAQ